jgi:ACS family tartrate transporter-like MFS transporter
LISNLGGRMTTTLSNSPGGFGERLQALIWRKPAGTIAERTRRRIAFHLIPWLFFLYILAYLDRVNVSVAQLAMQEPPLQTSVASAVGLLASPAGPAPLAALGGFVAGRSELLGQGGLGFTPEVIGIGIGIFFWGYWILEIPSTVSVVRWGARWVFVRILILWGICAALVGMIGTPLAHLLLGWLPFADTPVYQFYVFRLLLGFFEGGFFPSVIVYLSIWFRGEDRAKAIASFMIAIPVANLLGNPLSGFLLGIHWLDLPGWRWVFILEGIAPILAGIATLFFLPDNPAKATWLPADERAWLLAELDREHQAKLGHGYGVLVHHLGMIALLTVVYFCLNVTSYGLTGFMPAIIKSQAGVSNQVASYLAALPYLMAFIAMLVNGWHSDRTGERFWHVAVPLALLSVGIWIAAALDGVSVVPVLVMIALVGTFMYAHLPAFWPVPTMFLGATVAAAAIGFINMIGNLGGSVGPMVVGKAATGQTSFAPALLRIAPWPLVGALIILIVGYLRRRSATPARRNESGPVKDLPR